MIDWLKALYCTWWYFLYILCTLLTYRVLVGNSSISLGMFTVVLGLLKTIFYGLPNILGIHPSCVRERVKLVWPILWFLFKWKLHTYSISGFISSIFRGWPISFPFFHKPQCLCNGLPWLTYQLTMAAALFALVLAFSFPTVPECSQTQHTSAVALLLPQQNYKQAKLGV